MSGVILMGKFGNLESKYVMIFWGYLKKFDYLVLIEVECLIFWKLDKMFYYWVIRYCGEGEWDWYKKLL